MQPRRCLTIVGPTRRHCRFAPASLKEPSARSTIIYRLEACANGGDRGGFSFAGGDNPTPATGLIGVPASTLKEGENREDAAVLVAGVIEIEFAEDVADVLFDGARADEELVGDSGVRFALGH